MRLSNQEKKDLDKYTKFFTYKSTQIIVQSRIGERICTPNKSPMSGTESFNLNVPDVPSVLGATKKVLNWDVMLTGIPLCVEISLRTPEGDGMVLEYWCLSLLPVDKNDNVSHMIQNIYNRMGILLKSLVSVTRVTPAYKLSRRQGPESYTICYRVLMEQPQMHTLGDGHKQVKIGDINTPIGKLHSSVCYRTKMTISPTQTGKNSIMVKSDHFNSNSNPRRHRNNDDIDDLTKPMRPGPFADPKPTLPEQSELPEIMRLLSMTKLNVKTPPSKEEESENDLIESQIINDEKSGETNGSIESPSNSSPNLSPPQVSAASLLKSIEDEDYWMKELHAPFATRGIYGELMNFYRQCKLSPPLQSPQKNPTSEEVNDMIRKFETDLSVYDDLVHSMHESSEN